MLHAKDKAERDLKLKPLQIVFILISVLIMAFAFTNSAATGVESGGLSDAVVAFINEKLGIPVTSFIVRKAAHFTEFAFLGLSLFFASGHRIPVAGTIGILYAVSDELHQRFVPGRSCEIRDMLIDTSGVICGVLLTYLITRLWQRNRSKREQENSKEP